MATAKEYLTLFHTTCTFIDWDKETHVETKCDRPLSRCMCRMMRCPRGDVCQQHAEKSERHGDGPVFWQRFPVPQGDGENRLTGGGASTGLKFVKEPDRAVWLFYASLKSRCNWCSGPVNYSPFGTARPCFVMGLYAEADW
jgi:hypothetical protein